MGDPTQAFYDRISVAYDLLADASEHAARETGLELLGVAPAQRVLEIGVGTGRGLPLLARSVGAVGFVTGLDLSGGMLRVARRFLDGQGLERVGLIQGDARCLPQRDRSLDAVFMSFTLELFPESEIPRVLAEIARVLVPGGRLGIVSLSATPDPGIAPRVYVWLHRHFPHFVDCQPIDVTGALSRGGLTLLRSRELAIWGLPVLAAVARH